MTFEEWNAILARTFFNQGQAGKRVYLHTTRELLCRLSDKPDGVQDFIAAIKQGPRQFAHGEMCVKAIRVCSNWRNRNLEHPPYLAYLCFFSLAAAHDGNWPRHAYYPRVHDLLGDSQTGAPTQFRSMSDALWRDLEVWTHVDKKGEWGIFKFQSALEWVYVGLPIAQTILTEEERAALPELFEKADLEPGAILPEGQLASVLAPIAERRLRRRTIQLLTSSENSDYHSSLLEIIQSELSEWDGSVPAGADEVSERRAGLRLWLKEIDPAGFIASRLVAFLPDSMDPSDMLLESRVLNGRKFECAEGSGRITDALKDTATNLEFEASELSWQTRSEFLCIHTGTRLIFPAAHLRIFSNGGVNMTGFVESKKVPAQGCFFIAAYGPTGAEMDQWGNRCCASWKELHSPSGLPTGWRIFEGADPSSDGNLAGRFPALARPAAPRILFEGGVSSGNGAAYFPFAPPDVVVDWHEKPTKVMCDERTLQTSDGFRYTLSHDGLRAVNSIVVEIADKQLHASLFIRSDGWTWSEGADCPVVNQFGEKLQGDGTTFSARGAAVNAPGAPEFEADAESVVEETDCAVLLGRVPGQIADIRRGDSLPNWSAVWAVSTSRKRVVFAYCGSAIEACRPASNQREGNPKRWAKVIWVNRRVAEPLKHPRIRELLSAYREVARGI